MRIVCVRQGDRRKRSDDMKEITVRSLADTARLAERIARQLPAVACITLDGDLGAGKTTFTKALGKALGVMKTINSPTFTILKRYAISDGRTLYHIDAYRLEGITQELGFEEVFEDGICVVEWPAFIADQLPKERLAIRITRMDEELRQFSVDGIGALYETIVEAL